MKHDPNTMQAIYNKTVETLERHKKHGKIKGPFPLTQGGFLQVEQQLVTGQNQYSFNINKNTGGTIRTTETKLDQNDAFVAILTGIFLKKEDPAKAGSAVLHSYANATVFTAEAGNLVIADLEAVFNSKLAIKVGDKVFSRAIDTQLSRVVRTTAATERFGDDGFFHNTPIITFDGGETNEITLTMPTWAGQLIQYVTAPERMYVVLKFSGLLISGGGKMGVLL